MPDQTTRESIPRHEFAAAVRDAENRSVAEHGHHPGTASYTPSAFRHYTRERALLRRLRGIEFSTALDVGCSEGYFMEAFRREFGAAVWGVDISTVAAERTLRDYGMPTACADAIRLPFPDNAFDLVFATETIEHVLDPADMLAEMRRVSKRWVLITTPISKSADEHEPDYDLEHEGHVNNFDPATMHALCGPTASYGSFRNNSTFALIAAGARKLPAPFRDWFYALDLAVSQRLGKPMHKITALRNRDWLILDEVSGDGAATEPRWACPVCHADVTETGDEFVCAGCSRRYPVHNGVPDFFGPTADA